jgi:8-oxo-dGTP diphosphatase
MLANISDILLIVYEWLDSFKTKKSSFLSDALYGLIYRRSVRMCVDMVIFNEEGNLLLCLRDIEPYKGLWHFPGGAVRFKETIEQAARRIATREFGCSVVILDDIGCCETLNDDLGPNDKRHSNSAVVTAKLLGTPTSTKESSRVGYFNKLPENMHPYHKAFIERKGIL